MDVTKRRRWPRFSLWSLLFLVTIAGPVTCVVHRLSQPFVIAQTIDCGRKRIIEILEPTEFCDVAHRVSYRYSGMPNYDAPPSFGYWSCGYSANIVLVTTENGNLVGVAEQYEPNELMILIDFERQLSWPSSVDRKVDQNARELLEKLRHENGELWLSNTYDGELTKPKAP